MARLVVLLIALLLAGEAVARPLVADLSRHDIRVDSSFTGTDLLMFGAQNDPGDVLIVVRGPEKPVVMRKKERVFGVWVNTKQVNFAPLPYYYFVSATRPIADINGRHLMQALGIGLDNLKFISLNKNQNAGLLREFQEAYVADRMRKRLFINGGTDITFMGESLFKQPVYFPDTLTKGTYTAEVYLFSDGELVGMQSTPLSVRRKGFEAVLYALAHQHPYAYGALAVFMALLAGWGAGFIFKRV